ncbi:MULTISPECIES: DUF565 domain-containing protein [Leptolyngbya]|jgi:hypothetical protein|uniref:Ycf20-like protein n=2 Tax=Leptolyngbya boryana TaxID=1184 RepID=A0A1Z4JNZ4_LEPBY|nr:MULTISPECIES: DUF565 domain-containing protein [Leptolyngbya]BAY58434.1 hypothetical protein NIES2135_53070 [Leptolyngbya boryana NIES-2135]MBD1858889.1 DUF565 domain-containing protein [Leptolyngbya sp. FACHB-1624]MBD2368109.1 DUF565 domain-containing protein [Leptolyngbya sp. FACHB-161]MBD2374633.1 DUF565 domain-containing protein [Leptolyngbya sp. FACHB-238]MBD2399055.1 DUF565 domain-containing protein [Leptolyngbya sp. FACHB-239]
MQNTRLSTIVNTTAAQLNQTFQNPWRRISLLLISWLLGFFLGSAISTTAGQQAELDIVAAAVIVLVIEVISWLAYGGSERYRRSLIADVLNSLKIGVMYSLFLEAFKLGS